MSVDHTTEAQLPALSAAEATGSQDLERRAHPRVEIRTLVKVIHPTLPATRCTVENSSDNGVFLGTVLPNVKVGGQLKLQLLNTSAVEEEATPTVSMRVARIAAEGTGLTFSNRSARHLWQSAQRRRRALTVGIDYFQIHVNLVVMVQNQMLLLSQSGRWVLPNFYLEVGKQWQDLALAHLQECVGIAQPQLDRLLAADSLAVPELPETATMSLYQRVNVATNRLSLITDQGYTAHRWIKHARQLKELTVASANTSVLLEQLLSSNDASNEHDQP